MDDLTIPLLDAGRDMFPDWQPGTRPAHTVGVGAIGIFRGTTVARDFCIAEHFGTGWTPVTVRFSNGNGQGDPDWLPQVRGMAVKFHNFATRAADGTIAPRGEDEIEEADLISMSVPLFVAKDPQAMLAFEKASVPRKVRAPGPLRKLIGLLRMCPVPEPKPRVTVSAEEGVLAWARDYPPSHSCLLAMGLATSQPPPASYARTSYHAVHAFEIEDPHGVKRFVRFSFEPAHGVRRLKADEVAGLSDTYLRDEIAARLARERVRFNLRMQIADPLDDPTDPTTAWPSNRREVLMGTLELRALAVDQAGAGNERLCFNAGRLPKGIALTDDQILRARIDIYNESQRRRGALVEPIGHSTPAVPS